jgi:hypothetical protein
MNVNPRDRIRRYIDKPVVLDDFLELPQPRGFAKGFCQALQLEVTGPALNQKWKVPEKQWLEFPWVTLVLGSGPVGLPDSFWGVVKLLPDLVVETIKELRDEGNKLVTSFPVDAGKVVREFLKSLTRERVGDLPKRAAPEEQPTVGDLTAALVLLAAQLTRVFHMVSLVSNRPVSRWVSVVAQIPRRGAPDDLDDEVTAVQAALEFAQKQLDLPPPAWIPGEKFTNAVGRLLAAIDTNLSGKEYEVSLDHLRAVTDVAWQCLVWEVCGDSYPGWTELMLDLVLLQETSEPPVDRRPRWSDLTELTQQIAEIISPAARHSWQQRWSASGTTSGPEHPDATRDFYHAAASLLWQQAAAGHPPRSAESDQAEPTDEFELDLPAANVPKAVAFVTSFDLELEMALLHTRPKGAKKLSVVIPVYLVNRGEQEGEILWLEGVVDFTKLDLSGPISSKEALSCLTTPAQWRVIYEGRTDLPKHPIVVRLTGSPLMVLPPLPVASRPSASEEIFAADLAEVGVVENDGTFVHSATVDEYLALRQAEAESFLVYSRRPIAGNQSRALPKSLLKSRYHGPVRFWVTVGVPLKDPAVRLRVLKQMGGRRFMDDLQGRSDPPAEPGAGGDEGGREIPGLAINWKLDEEESMLLSSLGLRVIKQGRAEEFAKHLAHHAWHLGAYAAGQVPRASQTKCPEDPALRKAGR